MKLITRKLLMQHTSILRLQKEKRVKRKCTIMYMYMYVSYMHMYMYTTWKNLFEKLW